MVKHLLRFTALALVAAASQSCLAEFSNPEPTTLEVILTESTVSAARTVIAAVVKCDAKWTASVSDGDWAKIESLTTTSDGGAFMLSFGPNTEEHSRAIMLKVTSGSRISSHIITQGGLSTFFSPRTITIEGELSGSTKFSAPESWTAEITEGAEWL